MGYSSLVGDWEGDGDLISSNFRVLLAFDTEVIYEHSAVMG